MITYRVRDWDVHFENNRTRELIELRYVCMPNKHDGDGYTELVDHPSGAAHLGGWCAIVQVASKCKPRGTLIREGNRPHDSASLARQTRLPKRLFDTLLPRRVSIGWLESEEQQQSLNLGTIPQEGAAPYAHARDLSFGKEGIGKEKSAARPPDSAAERVEKVRDRLDGVVLRFPVIAGRSTEAGEWELTQKKIDDLQQTFPAVDVASESRKARGWVIANPAKRKTANGMASFLYRWMSRAQDAGGTPGFVPGGGSGGGSRNNSQSNSAAQRRSDKLAGRDYERIGAESLAYDDRPSGPVSTEARDNSVAD